MASLRPTGLTTPRGGVREAPGTPVQANTRQSFPRERAGVPSEPQACAGPRSLCVPQSPLQLPRSPKGVGLRYFNGKNSAISASAASIAFAQSSGEAGAASTTVNDPSSFASAGLIGMFRESLVAKARSTSADNK